MAEVQDCPRCGLVNPPSAERCDCGYDFVSRRVERSYLGAAGNAASESPSFGEYVLCVFLPLIGLLCGVRARSRGRLAAGRVMIIVSLVAGTFGLMLRLAAMAG